MEGFYLLCAHLLGDYILQTDWQARLKSAGHPGRQPNLEDFEHCGCPEGAYSLHVTKWQEQCRDAGLANIACTVHCLLYTLAVAAFSFWWMPWWGYVVCFVAHWIMDRFRLARLWMTNVSWQTAFATGPLSPWSVIVVDNTFHLLTLAAIAFLAGRV